MVTIIGDGASVANHFLRELRDVELQKDPLRFASNLKRFGLVAGYELSKSLDYSEHATKTPLGTAKMLLIKEPVVVCTVLRAGLPLQSGLQEAFSEAELAFIGAGRKPEAGGQVEIDLSYIAAPKLAGKILILADTMLATGNSLVDAYQALVAKHGKPKQTFIVAVIASQDGVNYVAKNIPGAKLFAGAVDPELNDKFYIVPGLGDAGDLLYGAKL